MKAEDIAARIYDKLFEGIAFTAKDAAQTHEAEVLTQIFRHVQIQKIMEVFTELEDGIKQRRQRAIDVLKAAGSLKGANVTPAEGAHFSGVMAVPIGFREEGESDNEVAARWLDHLEAKDARDRADAWARSPAGTPYGGSGE